MDNFDEKIRYELTDISEQEVLAVFTLVEMLKQKREAALLKMPIPSIITTDKCEREIIDEITSNKKRRCHSLQNITMFRKNEPDFSINDINKPTKPTYEEDYLYNDVLPSNVSIISSCSSMDLIDSKEKKNDKDITSSIQSFSTNPPSIQQSVISNTKFKKAIRQLVSLFDSSDYYYRSSPSSHMPMNHFNKRSAEQEKNILINFFS